jgi:gamma-glutamylcyclotransferase (GGCT)/AIG2-like uncharacterized protein YtfP
VNSHLFVYGTLRQNQNHEMNRVMSQQAQLVGSGKVMARLYDLGDYPGIVLSSSEEEWVVGEVYGIAREKAPGLLRALDDYEGLGPDAPLPHEYGRITVEVQLDGGKALMAWAYVLADPDPKYPRIAGSDYLEWKRRINRV